MVRAGAPASGWQWKNTIRVLMSKRRDRFTHSLLARQRMSFGPRSFRPTESRSSAESACCLLRPDFEAPSPTTQALQTPRLRTARPRRPAAEVIDAGEPQPTARSLLAGVLSQRSLRGRRVKTALSPLTSSCPPNKTDASGSTSEIVQRSPTTHAFLASTRRPGFDPRIAGSTAHSAD